MCLRRWMGHPLRCVCRVPTRDGAHGMHWHAEPGLQLEGWCMYHLPCFIVCYWCPLVWQGSVLTKRTARAAHHRQTCGPHLQQLRLWAVHGSQGILPGCIRCNVTPCVGQAASAPHALGPLLHGIPLRCAGHCCCVLVSPSTSGCSVAGASSPAKPGTGQAVLPCGTPAGLRAQQPVCVGRQPTCL